jgi:hypothetical protein
MSKQFQATNEEIIFLNYLLFVSFTFLPLFFLPFPIKNKDLI